MASSDTILDQIPDLATLTPLVTAAQNGFRGVLAELPEDLTTVLGTLPSQLVAIGALLPADPRAAWTSGLEIGLRDIRHLVPADTAGLLTPLVDGLAGLDAIVQGTPLGALITADGAPRSIAEVISGRLPELTNPFLAQLGELPGQLLPADQIAQIDAFLQAIADFQANVPSDPGELAEFLAQSFIGLPGTLLASPADVAIGVLGRLDDLNGRLAAGLPADTAAQARQAMTAAANLVATMDLTSPADYDAVLAVLSAARVQSQTVASTLETLFDGVDEAVTVLDLSRLRADLESALAAVPEIDVITVNDIRQTILDVLRTLIGQMRALDPQVAVDRIRAFSTQVESALGELGLDRARQTIFGVFDEVIAALEAIDVESVKQAIQDLFDAIQQAITDLNLEDIKTTIENAFGQVEQLVDSIDLQATVESLAELVNRVTAALDAIPLEQLRDQVETAFGTIEAALNSLSELAQTALQELQSILSALDEVDFRAAAEPVIEAINGLEDLLESIDLNALPDPIQQALSEAVRPLREVDFEAEISQPLLETYDAIAAIPQTATQEIAAKLRAIEGKIGALDPAALLAPLQEVYKEVTQVLDGLDPDDLLGPIQETLDWLVAALEELEPEELLAPLQGLYDDLMAAFEQLDPDALLAPLEEAFEEVEALLDRLDLTPVFEELKRLQAELFGQVRTTLVDDLDLSGLPGSVTDLLDKVGPLMGIGEGTIRPGDLFLPLAGLYEQLLAALDAVPTDLLLTAFNALRDGLMGALETLTPATLTSAIGDKAAVIVGAFDAVDPEPLIADLTTAHTGLSNALNNLDQSQVSDTLRSQFQAIQDLVAELDPSVVLAPVQTVYASQRPQVQALAQPVDLSGLEELLDPLQAKIERLVPPFLLDEITADNLRSGLEAFSPAGIADEINAAFDEFKALATDLANVIEPEIQALLDMLATKLMVVEPSGLQAVFTEILDTLKAKLAVLDPTFLKEEIRETFDAVKAALANLNPATLAQGLRAAFEAARDKLVALDLTPLRQALTNLLTQVKARLKLLNPARLVERLAASFAQIKALLEGLDILAAIRSFGEALARLRGQLVTVLEAAQGAFAAMLAAIPV